MTRLFTSVCWALLLMPLAGCGNDERLSPVKVEGPGPGPQNQPPEEEDQLLVHYYRPLGDYEGWLLSATGDLPKRFSGTANVAQGDADSFGATFTVPTTKGAANVRFTIAKDGSLAPDGEVDVPIVGLGKEVWVYSEKARAFAAAPAIPEDGTAVIYYRRADGLYAGWGLHLWGDTTDMPSWNEPVQAAGEDQFGAYYITHLTADAQQVNFIIHQGDNKDPGPDQALLPGEKGRRIWVLSGDTTLYTHPADPPLIDARRAHWVDLHTIAWNLSGDDSTLASTTFALHYAADGSIRAEGGSIVGGEEIPLSFDPTGLPTSAQDKFPHLGAYKALRLADAAADLDTIAEILKGQIIVSASLPNGSVVATGVQVPGVLDDLYAYDGPLGVDLTAGAPTLRVWAPTARSVNLHLFDDPSPDAPATVMPMSESNGVWSAAGDAAWIGKFYLYEVEVFAPSSGQVEHNLVTDPYSISLSTNSQRSQIVDLDAPMLKPLGWDTLGKPPFTVPEQAAIYELHVRDFSVNDPSVPAAQRGTFLAFTQASSYGMSHLENLAQAGLTHVHILPSFDFATVNEERAEQKEPGNLSVYAPDSEKQQAAIQAIRDEDAFNWGYDPWHYTVPEGSYATDPNGPDRILEFRGMVKALNEAGLRVVMDVVYNHTTASGQNPRSVLDRIVPGYYHRLDDKGAVSTSTCCQNTATEHVMMEKLMVDSLVTWARAYKVDGFRFDLMGHHMKANMIKVQSTLAALTPAQDGVDGASILLYGEGWNFGEVANNARGVNATQSNMAGTGIGTFNDRLRDAVRGGGPFDSGDDLRKQGFSNGLFTDPNDANQGTPDDQKARLLLSMDQIRVGLAGNLRDYSFVDRTGSVVTGAGVDYNGSPSGYTLDPQEGITYVEAHDNQTLWDILQYKIPSGTAVETRVRMQNLAVSVTALGLGVPFFHAGVDMLRSKSGERDSYNSGDWFNRLDFTYATNNWAVGLPLEDNNGGNWYLLAPLLVDPDIHVEQAQIQGAVGHLQEMLRIRRSTPLFRLETAEEVMGRLQFHNTGVDQIPGVIVMSISDEVNGLPDLDPAIEGLVVVFNGRPDDVMLTLPGFGAALLALHPVQQASADPVVQTASFAAGMFSVPARTAAVFVGSGLP